MRLWVEWAVRALALVGLWVTVDKTAAGILRAWTWLRYDRVTPLLEDDEEPLEELPPERSWEEMTADQPIVVDRVTLWGTGREQQGPATTWRPLSEARERRPEPWEAFQRLQYEAMGFEFPSGMVARVRELTP